MGDVEEKNKTKKGYKVAKWFLITVIILLLVIVISINLCSIFLQKNKNLIIEANTKSIIGNEENIEYGSKMTYSDIVNKLVVTEGLYEGSQMRIYINDVLLKDGDEYVFDKNGDIKLDINILTSAVPILMEDISIDKQFIWKVSDTKLPVLEGVQDVEIEEGSDIDVKANIKAKDEVDGELEVTVEGEFDKNVAGTYTLTAKAVDKNGNAVSKEFKLTVKEKPKEEEIKEETSNNKVSSNNTSKNTSKNTTNNNSNKGSSSSNNNSSNNNSNSGNSNKGSESNNQNTNGNSSSSSSNETEDLTATKAGRLTLAKQEAKNVAKKIIKSGMTKEQKGRAICDYITNNVATQTNQSSEAYKTNFGNEAYAALVLKIAACSGRCKAAVLLCNEAGLKCEHVNQGQWTHQWLRVEIENGKWVVMDPQIGLFGADKHPLEYE